MNETTYFSVDATRPRDLSRGRIFVVQLCFSAFCTVLMRSSRAICEEAAPSGKHRVSCCFSPFEKTGPDLPVGPIVSRSAEEAFSKEKLICEIDACPLGRGCVAYGPWFGAAQLQGGGLTAPLKGSILNIEKKVLPANGQPPFRERSGGRKRP